MIESRILTWMKVLSQTSVATTIAVSGSALHSTVVSFGKLTKVGAIVSITVMTCVWTVALPHSSVAVQVRVIVDEPVQLPGIVSLVMTTLTILSQLSVALKTAATGIALQLTVVSAGAVSTIGSTLSSTVIVWIELVLLPQSSVAVYILLSS